MSMVLLCCVLVSDIEIFNLYLPLCFGNNVDAINLTVGASDKLYIDLCPAVPCCGHYVWPI